MIYDIVIIGSGPAGLTAAIYGARASKKVLVIEKESFGGLITHSPKVENYPGFNIISGLDLADKFVAQAMELKVNFEFDEVVEVILNEDKTFTLKCVNNEFLAKSVIIATGSKHRHLNLENEQRLTGHGISYCAVCDGPFYTDKDVVIIGGGNSAMQEALLLSSYCKSVTMIQNLPYFTGEKSLKEQIEKTPNISVMFNTLVVGLIGESNLQSIILKEENKEERVLNTDGVFVAIGQVANNEPFKNVCELNRQGFIISDNECNSKVRGVYVAGDCVDKKVRQIVTAMSDGSVAALQAIRYLDSQ